MKLTKLKLKQIIKEELKAIKESYPEHMSPEGDRTGAFTDIGGGYDVLPENPIQLIFQGLKELADWSSEQVNEQPDLEGTINAQVHQLKQELIKKIDETWDKPDWIDKPLPPHLQPRN
jgi:hypothetical protein